MAGRAQSLACLQRLLDLERQRPGAANSTSNSQYIEVHEPHDHPEPNSEHIRQTKDVIMLHSVNQECNAAHNSLQPNQRQQKSIEEAIKDINTNKYCTDEAVALFEKWNPMEEDFMSPTFNSYDSGPGKDLPLLNQRPITEGEKKKGHLFELYVTGIPNSMSEVGLKNLFSRAGQVVSAKKITNKNLAYAGTYGFVTFRLMSEVESAIRMLDNFPIGPCMMRVKIALSEEEREARRRNKAKEVLRILLQQSTPRDGLLYLSLAVGPLVPNMAMCEERGFDDVTRMEISSPVEPTWQIRLAYKLGDEGKQDVEEGPDVIVEEEQYATTTSSNIKSDKDFAQNPDATSLTNDNQSSSEMIPNTALPILYKTPTATTSLPTAQKTGVSTLEIPHGTEHRYQEAGLSNESQVEVKKSVMKKEARPCMRCGVIAYRWCSRCRGAYCSTKCQQQDWMKHKLSCQKPSNQFEEKFEIEDDDIDDFLQEVVNTKRIDKSDLSREHLPLGQPVEVMLTDLQSPSELSVVHLHNKLALRDLQDNLNQKYAGHSSDVSYTPEVGDVCAAPYQGEWYRGLIETLDVANQEAFVLYIDYGNREVVSTANLTKLLPAMVGMPAQAILCKLDVEPLEETWSERTPDILLSLLNMDGVITATALGASSGQTIVNLQKGGVSFSDILVKEGIAKKTDRPDQVKRATPSTKITLGAAHVPSAAGDPGFAITTTPITGATQQNASPSCPSPSQNPDVPEPLSSDKTLPSRSHLLTSGDHGSTSDFDVPKVQFVKNEEISVGHEMLVGVVHVHTMDKFWVQDVNKQMELALLQSELNQTYSAKQPKTGFREPKHKLVAAFHTGYSEWYRGHVLGCNTSQVHVFFLDFGNAEWVEFHYIHSLDSKFCSLPAQALPCKLNDSICRNPINEGLFQSYIHNVHLRLKVTGWLKNKYVVDLVDLAKESSLNDMINASWQSAGEKRKYGRSPPTPQPPVSTTAQPYQEKEHPKSTTPSPVTSPQSPSTTQLLNSQQRTQQMPPLLEKVASCWRDLDTQPVPVPLEKAELEGDGGVSMEPQRPPPLAKFTVAQKSGVFMASELSQITHSLTTTHEQQVFVVNPAMYDNIVIRDVEQSEEYDTYLDCVDAKLAHYHGSYRPQMVGELVYVKDDRCGWTRGEVRQISAIGTVRVLLVDSGRVTRVALSELARIVRGEIPQPPVLGTHCALWNIESLSEGIEWERDILPHVNWGEMMTAIAMNEPKPGVFDIELFPAGSEQSLNVILAHNELANPIDLQGLSQSHRLSKAARSCSSEKNTTNQSSPQTIQDAGNSQKSRVRPDEDLTSITSPPPSQPHQRSLIGGQQQCGGGRGVHRGNVHHQPTSGNTQKSPVGAQKSPRSSEHRELLLSLMQGGKAEQFKSRHPRVSIFHVDDPGSFYVRCHDTVLDFECEEQRFRDDMTLLLRQWHNNDPQKYTPSVGDFVAVLSPTDNNWYRGQVLENSYPPGVDKIMVWLLDHGMKDLVSADVIRPLSKKHKRFPFQAIHCKFPMWDRAKCPNIDQAIRTLKDLEQNDFDLSLEGFDEVSQQYLVSDMRHPNSEISLVRQNGPLNQVLTMKPLTPTILTTQASVQDIQVKTEHKQAYSSTVQASTGNMQANLYSNQASKQYVPATLGNKLINTTRMHAKTRDTQITTGGTQARLGSHQATSSVGNIPAQFRGVISHINSISDFCVQPVEYEAMIAEVQQKVNSFCQHKETKNIRPQISEQCLAKYSDGIWYRAQVTAYESLVACRVIFIDYGNSESVLVSDIRSCPADLSCYPRQAFRCSLNGIQEPAGGWRPCDNMLFEEVQQGDPCQFISVDVYNRDVNRVIAKHPIHGDLAELLATNGIGNATSIEIGTKRENFKMRRENLEMRRIIAALQAKE